MHPPIDREGPRVHCSIPVSRAGPGRLLRRRATQLACWRLHQRSEASRFAQMLHRLDLILKRSLDLLRLLLLLQVLDPLIEQISFGVVRSQIGVHRMQKVVLDRDMQRVGRQ